MELLEIDGGDVERLMLVGLIRSPEVALRLSGPVLKSGFDGVLKSWQGNLIAGWAARYWEQYKVCPENQIHHLFQAWKLGEQSADRVESVAMLLKAIAEESRRTPVLNAPYVLDRASSYMSQVAIERLASRLQGLVLTGKVKEAEQCLQEFSAPSIQSDSWFDPLSDSERIAELWNRMSVPLLHWPGDLGTFFGPTFGRDKFVGFRGISKAGKSFVLMDVATRALLADLKVAVFCLGDLSEAQLLHRFATRITQRPLYSKAVRIPESWDPEAHGFPLHAAENRRAVTPDDLQDVGDQIYREGEARGSRLRMVVKPARTYTMAEIANQHHAWSREGFVPDFTIIDYLEMIADPVGQRDRRLALDANWAGCRTLSQTWHSCVVTATQSSADGYDADQSLGTFSGTRTQNDHLTALIGLNQSEEDVERGVQRWQMLLNRDIAAGRQIWVAGSREIGSPAIISQLITDDAPVKGEEI